MGCLGVIFSSLFSLTIMRPFGGRSSQEFPPLRTSKLHPSSKLVIEVDRQKVIPQFLEPRFGGFFKGVFTRDLGFGALFPRIFHVF